MAKPNRIGRIVAELRWALGPNVPAWELLKLARYIIEAHREPEGIDYNQPTAHLPFASRAVDEAIVDGGWKVLEHERRRGLPLDEEISDNECRVEARLRALTGRTGWRRIGME